MRGRDLKPGETFEGYRIERLLGAGGMGEVYHAVHLFTEREVALKIILAERVANADARLLMQKEARILCRLKHPNIVHVLTAEHLDDGTVYIAMELLHGITLRHRIHTDAPLPVAEALLIAIECGRALAYGHKIDIVHRDIKPENIFIDSDHTVKVLDYGIAKLGTLGMRSTRSERRFGTPAYSAPEQLTGGRVGPWTDVYALGTCLYEMLSGRHPFATGPGHEGMPRGPALCLAQELETPHPIVTFLPEFTELSYVLEPLWVALRKEAGERYGAMSDFIQALQSARDRYVDSVTRKRTQWPVTEEMVPRLSAEALARPKPGGTEEMPHVTAARRVALSPSPAPAVVQQAPARLPALIGTAPERAEAARRLRAHDEAKARERLVAGVETDPDARVRAACAESLAVIGDANALSALRGVLSRETDARARKALYASARALAERFHEPPPPLVDTDEPTPLLPVVRAAAPPTHVVVPSPRPLSSKGKWSRALRSAALGAAIGIPAAAVATIVAVKLARPQAASAAQTEAPTVLTADKPDTISEPMSAFTDSTPSNSASNAQVAPTALAPGSAVSVAPKRATGARAVSSAEAVHPKTPQAASARPERIDGPTPIFQREE